MALGIHRPILNRDLICLLVPTRARPASLRALLDSIGATASRPQLIELWAWVDQDDTPTIELLGEGSWPFGVHFVSGPRTATQGEMYNRLREACPSGPGIYMAGGDKITFITPGWDEITRRAFDELPDRLLFAHPWDRFNRESFGAFFFLSAEWANACGRVMSEHFPYWFDDTWWNEVAMMLGRKRLLDFTLRLEPARAWRMENVLFWERYFYLLLDERMQDALRLCRLIHGQDQPALQAHLVRVQAWVESNQSCLKPQPERDALLVAVEAQRSARLLSENPRSEPGSDYRRVEDAALARLQERLIPLLNQGRRELVDQVLDAMAHSSKAAEELIGRGQRCVERGDVARARPVSQRLLELFPHFPEGHGMEFDLRVLGGDREGALQTIERAAALFPECQEIQTRATLIRRALSPRV